MIKMTRRRLLPVIFTLIAVGIAACQPIAAPDLPAPGETSPPRIQPATLTPFVVATTPASEPHCAYIWANAPLPELTAQLEAWFQEAGLVDVAVRAEAYGENCVLADGRVEGFLPMVTDIHLILPVGDVTDEESLGQRLKPVLELLAGLPADQLPGSGGFGNVASVFSAREDERRMLFPFERAQQALDDGLAGAELIQALSNP